MVKRNAQGTGSSSGSCAGNGLQNRFMITGSFESDINAFAASEFFNLFYRVLFALVDEVIDTEVLGIF